MGVSIVLLGAALLILAVAVLILEHEMRVLQALDLESLDENPTTIDQHQALFEKSKKK